MESMDRCAECGIPSRISVQLDWGNNGVITPAGSPRGRMVLYESRIIDNLFKGIEELIGLPIEHIVIESRRREVRRFFEKFIPEETRRGFQFMLERLNRGDIQDGSELRKLLEVAGSLLGGVLEMGRVYGYGDSRLGDAWEREEKYPWRTNIVSHPYSLPFWVAEIMGSIEAIEGADHEVEYEEMGGETYRVTASPGSHYRALKERLRVRRYDLKPGDIALERCSTCGLPLGVAHYIWNAEEGTITDPDNGHRMAIYSPTSLQAVLDDLETELGESVPELVIEAQRRFVRSRVGADNWRRSGTTFQQLTALRGLGNLIRFEADEHRLDLTIENSCLPLLMVGMAKAIYEIALNYQTSSHGWKLAEDGDLTIAVRA